MLSKQSIRKNVIIYLNNELIEKEILIEMSRDYSERELGLVRKMIKQEGKVKIQGNLLQFVRTDVRIRNSKGEFESLNIKPSSLSDFDF
jgi:hypothetical protein